MRIIKSNSTDAYFNMAIEEYLINKYEGDFIIISTNEPSIVVGKNQNTYDEVNALYVQQNKTKVVRRMTGGSTVFQDHGNVNISKIYKDDGSKLGDFSKLSEIIVAFLKSKFDLETEYHGRNILIAGGKKFSGHVRTRIGNKLLHHGTILFSSNLKSLTNALKVNNNKYHDNTLRSTHENVTNLSEHIPEGTSLEEFENLFTNYIRNAYPDSKPMELSHEDIEGVQKLVDEKYSTYLWNYGPQVDFTLKKSYNSIKSNLDLYILLEEETIKNIRICGDFFSQKDLKDIEENLIECKFEKNAVTKVLSNFEHNDYFYGITQIELIDTFFN